MAHHELSADYLIVGSGAVGMAFADTLLTETDASMVIIDRYAKPGGHWNVAYPFVTLHQPSLYYGVSSRELSKGRVDQVGLNKGMNELATGDDVSAYFDEVMRHQFLPSGRVQYFPLCEYSGDGKFESMISGETYEVNVAKKTIDATFLKTSVPSTHEPSYTIDDGVNFIALNDLPKIKQPPAGFVVIGAGKTGIDACLWLLEQGIDPDKIRWIVPRDAWLIDRQNTQPTEAFFTTSMGAIAAQMDAIANAESIEDLFTRLESGGVLVRIDPTVKPQMFHAATVSQMELSELRRIRNVVRMGRVKHLQNDKIVLDDGTIETSPDIVHVDCSARAIPERDSVPVFNGDVVTPQTVRPFQPVFSAAFIAHIEGTYQNEDDDGKNAICGVVPLPNHDVDWIRMQAASMMNQYRWSKDDGIKNWLIENRLDGFSRVIDEVAPDDSEKMKILQRIQSNLKPAAVRIQQLVAELA